MLDGAMPWLIDGNNLIFALIEVGPETDRTGLCEWLERLCRSGERVCVAFDGMPDRGPVSHEAGGGYLEVLYSRHRTADALIVARIDADTAPRRLKVVSSDRQIRRAARRRGCISLKSEDFARDLVRLPSSPGEPPPPEPLRKKRAGLDEAETRAWLKEFFAEDPEEPGS
jgi:predicted RNA-binding protein with PIN domain